MANKPTNPALYSRVKSEAKRKFDRWPSAYGSAWLVKEYKRRGGGYRKAQDGMEVEDSINQFVTDMRQMNMGGMMYRDNMFDEGGEMALGQMAAVVDKLSKLQKFITSESEPEPWVASKLAVMDHSADAIYDYMMYNPEAQGEEMEEMREGGIPQRYKNKGFTRVGAKRQSTRPGKKWMVLAKKGDQYKVVHGGYKGMKDFTQHGNEKRKDRFWNRMGGRNSAKATDPFSPLYWHKRFGTWAEGGEPQNAGFQALPQEVQAKIMANMMYGGDMYAMGGMPCYECGGMKYELGGEWFNEDSQDFYRQGGIKLDPAKKGTFKAQATRMGMSVQEAAKKILDAPKGKYSPEMRRKANFARNFAKAYGGMMEYQMGGSGMGNMYLDETAFDSGMAGLSDAPLSPDIAGMREYSLDQQAAPAGFVSDIPAPARRGAGSGMGNMYLDQTDFDFRMAGLADRPVDADIAGMREYALDDQMAPEGTMESNAPWAMGPQPAEFFNSPLYFTADKKGNPMTEGEYKQSPVRKKPDIGKYAKLIGDYAGAGIDALSWMGKERKDKRAMQQARQNMLTENLYSTMPDGMTGQRGDYDTFGNFRPDEMGAFKTYNSQSFARQRGGEIELTDSQIRQLVALGAEIEILE
jgi:hypothetical protein